MEPFLSEIEARLEKQRYQLRALEQKVGELIQQIPRAWQQNPGTGGGDAKSYYAISDGAAVGSGTWPTFTPGSFTSDVWDMSTGTPELADSDATVLWFSLDPLANAGAPVECVKLSNGSYRGTLEHCTPIPADGA